MISASLHWSVQTTWPTAGYGCFTADYTSLNGKFSLGTIELSPFLAHNPVGLLPNGV